MKKILTSIPFPIILIILGVLWLSFDNIMLNSVEKASVAPNQLSFSSVRGIRSTDAETISFINYNSTGDSQVYCMNPMNNEIEFLFSPHKFMHITYLPKAIMAEDGSYYAVQNRINLIQTYYEQFDIPSSLCHFDSKGKLMQSFEINSLENNLYWELLYVDGKLYICESATSDNLTFESGRFSASEEKEEKGESILYLANFDTNELERIGSFAYSLDELITISASSDCFFVYYENGSLGKLSVNGEYELLYEVKEEEGHRDAIFSAAYIGDELYALSGYGGTNLVKIVDGKTQFVCDLAKALPEVYGDTEAFYSNTGKNELFSYGDKIGLNFFSSICIIGKDGQPITTLRETQLPFRYAIVSTLKNIYLSIRPYFLLVAGVILLLGNLVKWKRGLLFKNLLVLPISVALVFLIIAVCGSVEKSTEASSAYSITYFESGLIKEAIDGNVLRNNHREVSESIFQTMTSLRNKYPSLTSSKTIRIYQKQAEGKWLLLYSSDNRSRNLFHYVVNIPFDQMTYMEGCYYLFEENGNVQLVFPIYDDAGEETGAVVVSNKAAQLNSQLATNLSWIIASPFLVLTLVVLVLVTKYVLRNIMRVREGVATIGEGDYSFRLKKLPKDELGEIGAGINHMAEQVQKTQDAIITGMATMVEKRDNNTGGHIKRTSMVVKIFSKVLLEHADELGVDAKFLYNVEKAAPMHDMGKIAVDDSILRKAGSFTDIEFAIMKAHSEEGAIIVSQVLEGLDDEEFVKIAINVANFHHEKWNGQGYPTHIAAENIPLEARIMALADVFDALVSKRAYKGSIDYDKAFRIIEEGIGTHFDPRLGELFMQCRPELEELYNTIDH